MRCQPHRAEEQRHCRAEDIRNGYSPVNGDIAFAVNRGNDHARIDRAHGKNYKNAYQPVHNKRGRGGGDFGFFLASRRSRKERLLNGQAHKYQKSFHFSVNSINTSSRDDVPLTSSISPTATSSPPLITAILLQSFSATSRT